MFKKNKKHLFFLILFFVLVLNFSYFSFSSAVKIYQPCQVNEDNTTDNCDSGLICDTKSNSCVIDPDSVPVIPSGRG